MDVVTVPNLPGLRQARTESAFAYPSNRLPAGTHTDQIIFRQDFLSGRRRNLLFYPLGQPLIKEGVMKSSALLLFLMVLLSGCENTKGQDRHDPNHHDKVMQNSRE
jgi:hypothetical protein